MDYLEYVIWLLVLSKNKCCNKQTDENKADKCHNCIYNRLMVDIPHHQILNKKQTVQ